MSTGKQPLITLDTITEQVSATLEVRRSLFITYLAPVQNKESALQYLETLRKKHWDAAHHCYAWRLGHLGQDYRLADDGEPAGTAGKPILFVLQQGNFTNIIAVTVRYFGGVKLGKGPLARAYADSVRESVSMVTRLPVVSRKISLYIACMTMLAVLFRCLKRFKLNFQPNILTAYAFTSKLPSQSWSIS